VFKLLVRKCHRKDLKDPFQALLYNKNTDFLETDNLYISIFVIQIMNIALGFMISSSTRDNHMINDDEDDFGSLPGDNDDGVLDFSVFHNYINRAFEISALCLWIYFIWKGTKPEIFYSKCN
jgi:hypothetical protein